MRSSVVGYCRAFCGTVGHAASEGSALLELTFVIVLHLLLMRSVLPDTYSHEDTQDKQEQQPTPYDHLAEPQLPAAE